jgi:hypothetical protein
MDMPAKRGKKKTVARHKVTVLEEEDNVQSFINHFHTES